jgi:sigma-E factor negative regulatory protein RseC
MSNRISHSGVIESITDGGVSVRILQTSACAACKVASHCHASESKEKVVDVRCADGASYQKGQQVIVSASRNVANQALLLGFGLPLLVLVGVLVAVLLSTGDEAVAALCGLGALIPYYLILWLLRDSIGRRVTFQIEAS